MQPKPAKDGRNTSQNDGIGCQKVGNKPRREGRWVCWAEKDILEREEGMLSSQTSNHDTSKSALSQVEQRQSSVSAVVRCPHRTKGAATAIGGWSSGGWARTAARTAAEAAATELSQQEVVGIKARQDKTRNNSPSDPLASRGESACARVRMKGEKA